MATGTEAAEADVIDEIRPVDVIAASPLAISGLMQLINGHYLSQVIYVFARLQVADALAAGPKSAAELAAALNTHEGATARLLRIAQGIGLTDSDGKHHTLTEIGHFLRIDLPGSMRPLAILQGMPWRWPITGRLTEAVKTGEPQFAAVTGVDYYDFLESDRAATETFLDAMDCLALPGQLVAAASYDFNAHRQVLDIGGGDGTVLAAILSGSQHLRGHLLDRPHALTRAARVLSTAGLTDRVNLIEGDFFDQIPSGIDCYVLSLICNDCNDSEVVALLKNCASAMDEDARLVVLDLVLPGDGRLHHGDFLDVECLLFSGGAARTEEQFGALFVEAGLEILSFGHNPSPVSCLTAAKRQ